MVVGAGRGIGRAAARALASSGALVVAVSRTQSELESLLAEIRSEGGRAEARAMDVTDASQVEALAAEVRDGHGRLDILINSAGESFIGSLEMTDEPAWDRVLNVNLKGPYLCIRAMLDLLRASNGAWVINLASKVGLTGYAKVGAYTAAKAGLIGLGRALAQELRQEGIRLVTLCPGPVDTPMRWSATPDLDPSMVIPAESLAQTILYLVSLDRGITVSSEIVIEAVGYQEAAVPLEPTGSLGLIQNRSQEGDPKGGGVSTAGPTHPTR